MKKETIKEWKTREDQAQVIGQAELFTLIVSRLTWEKRLAGRKVVFFVDNESARIAALKSYSPVLPSLNILVQCVAFDYRTKVAAWYARVPACCNIADGPSRFQITEVLKLLKATKVIPIFPAGHSPAKIC